MSVYNNSNIYPYGDCYVPSYSSTNSFLLEKIEKLEKKFREETKKTNEKIDFLEKLIDKLLRIQLEKGSAPEREEGEPGEV